MESNVTCDGFPVLGVESLIDFIKQVERSRVAFLNCKNERQSDEGFLTAGELLHVAHFGFIASERDLVNRFLEFINFI